MTIWTMRDDVSQRLRQDFERRNRLAFSEAQRRVERGQAMAFLPAPVELCCVRPCAAQRVHRDLFGPELQRVVRHRGDLGGDHPPADLEHRQAQQAERPFRGGRTVVVAKVHRRRGFFEPAVEVLLMGNRHA
jgi:hypothetical protein